MEAFEELVSRWSAMTVSGMPDGAELFRNGDDPTCGSKDVDAPTEEQLRTLTAEDLAEENE